MKKLNIYILLLGLFLISSCSIYKFTGASLVNGEETISIQYFENQASYIHPTLSQTFTEALKDKFASQTSLELIKQDGDLNFEGEITGYITSPVAIQANETAALNRLTITIRVQYTNNKNDQYDFDTKFKAYEDFSSSDNLDDVADGLIGTITEKIIDDIFNKSVANW